MKNAVTYLGAAEDNLLLSRDGRDQAPAVQRGLKAAALALEGGLAASEELKEIARREIEKAPLARIDYLEIVDASTLQPVGKVSEDTVIATAVFFESVRLIDNLELSPPDSNG